MIIKTNLLEEYVNFVANTKKRNEYFKMFSFLIAIIMFLFLIFFLISIFKMNNTFSLQQISRTSNLDANLISRQYKLNLMANFMRVKYENPKLRQSEIPNQISLSTST